MAQESRNAMPQLTVASEPAEPQTTSELISTASPSGGDKKPKQKKNSLEEVEKMRREIRQLQEKRAAAMMNEVVELQRERDTAIARVKILKQSLEDLTIENTVLKEAVGRGDQVQQIFHLEKCLLEEQLYSSDLKKKLQSSNKQLSSLKGKLRALELQQREWGGCVSPLGAGSEEESVLERSRSMNDLGEKASGSEEAEGAGRGGGGAVSPPSQYHLPRLSALKLKEPVKKSTGGLVMSPHLPRPPSTESPSPSPTVIPRRYKLATAQSKSVATQADLGPKVLSNGDASLGDNPSQMMSGAKGQGEVEELKRENQVLENKISELTAEIAEYKAKEKTYKQLQTESEVLKDTLSEFSRWVRQKIQLVEEDIDVCRVIYTLHGSLSQEAAVLKELQNRLGLSEQKIAQLSAENRQLTETKNYWEEKCKQAKQQNELLQQKIILLTPTKSPKKPNYFPLTSSPKLQRPAYTMPSPSLPSLHNASSPLFIRRQNKATPTSGGGGGMVRTTPSPVRARRNLYAQRSSSDDDDNVVI